MSGTSVIQMAATRYENEEHSGSVGITEMNQYIILVHNAVMDCKGWSHRAVNAPPRPR